MAMPTTKSPLALLSIRNVGVALIALLCTACGGGGGGKPPSSTGGVGVLGVYANFSPTSSAGPTGVSEVYTVKTTAGTVLQSQTVNAPASSTATPPLINFYNLPSQTLVLHGVLYSGTNGTGTVEGTLDEAFSGASAEVISTAMGQPISTVIVTPGTDSVAASKTVQLYATAQDSNPDALFESSAATWSSSLTNLATVSTSGVVTGVQPGQATISAVLGRITGSTTVTVTGITRGTWTILVYMDADNDLDADSIQNEAQMEAIAQTPTSQTRIVLQWKLSNTVQSQSTDVQDHPFEGTERFVETQNGREMVQNLGANVDMGQPAALKDFVTWGVQNYPAQHYALVMWDHGNGWSFNATPSTPAIARGISYDYDTGNHINVNQLSSAISPNHMDILAFDACQMQMLEVESGVTGVADYMVGAEDNTPAPGYPYNTAFSQFFSNPTSSVPTLAEGIAQAFIGGYNGTAYESTPLSQSVVDLSKISAVTSSLNNFSKALLSASNVGTLTKSVRGSLINYAAGESNYYYDLGSIAKGYESSSAPSSVVSAAQSLASAESSAVLLSVKSSLSTNSTGISIDFSPSSAFSAYSSNYAQLAIAQQTEWPQFLASTTANP